jgi:hypothetical protein
MILAVFVGEVGTENAVEFSLVDNIGGRGVLWDTVPFSFLLSNLKTERKQLAILT